MSQVICTSLSFFISFMALLAAMLAGSATEDKKAPSGAFAVMSICSVTLMIVAFTLFYFGVRP